MDDPFPAGFAESAVYINAQAAANPTDEEWQSMKRQMDKIIVDFQAAKTRYDNIVAAIQAV